MLIIAINTTPYLKAVLNVSPATGQVNPANIKHMPDTPDIAALTHLTYIRRFRDLDHFKTWLKELSANIEDINKALGHDFVCSLAINSAYSMYLDSEVMALMLSLNCSLVVNGDYSNAKGENKFPWPPVDAQDQNHLLN